MMTEHVRDGLFPIASGFEEIAEVINQWAIL